MAIDVNQEESRKLRAARRLSRALQLERLPEFLNQPRVRIDLMHAASADNDPFFGRVVRDFYDEARAPHPKLPLVGRYAFGVALLRMPDRFEEYLTQVDGSARRNFRKAERGGYRFERIDFNAHLADIAELRTSTEVRQGPMRAKEVHPVTDPPTRSTVHDYPWFGVFLGDKLVAYGSCLVAGELCMLNHVLGHAAHQKEGVVPRLFMGISEYICQHYPQVKYFGYDMYFGASPSLRRFKAKLGFQPYRVEWVLDGKRVVTSPAPRNQAARAVPVEVPAQLDYRLIYRQLIGRPVAVEAIPGAVFHYIDNPASLALVLGSARARFPGVALVKALAKLATSTRDYYCVVLEGALVSDGWITRGRCNHYPIGPEDAVIGPVWTEPAQRGKGLARFALRSAVHALFERGHSVSYIDTTRDNLAMQKVIARSGYGPPIAVHLLGDEQHGS